ncbi:DUF58 domain-containing protein [Microbacterium flavum]|uniref:DUF58 domain-containing protein n=1 Tax=Microbacterium flavum TaxID=415216 RepID=A0ABS5XYY7_9MICO|nr:DUF58 domain-containing protein [Microbacterium flavum]MBT8799266.1 DUF58 domain-containing protein [Microbacterium flavum]
MSRFPLTARGTGAAVLAFTAFVAAHAFQITELLYISALLTVAVAGSVATLYLVRRTERVERFFDPDVGTVGRDLDVHLRVEIRSPLPTAQGRWRDRLPDGVTGVPEGVFPQTGSGMRTGQRGVDLHYSVTPQRRGIRNIGPISVSSTDPFGFARRRHAIGRPLPLTVTPAVLTLAPLADQAGDVGGTMHATTDQIGQGSDNLVPRHYAPGDSMRRIHWRASAHRDQLMVRQEEQESTPTAIVVLDRASGRWNVEATRAPGGDRGFETAVCACVSIAARLVQEGYLVRVVDFDGAALSDPIDGGDAAGIERLAIDLAPITARRDGMPETLAAVLSGETVGPLVVIGGVLTPPDAAALAPLAHHSSLPVLLAVTPTPGALAEAAASGWRVGRIATEDELEGAWADAVQRGAHRVFS